MKILIIGHNELHHEYIREAFYPEARKTNRRDQYTNGEDTIDFRFYGSSLMGQKWDKIIVVSPNRDLTGASREVLEDWLRVNVRLAIEQEGTHYIL